MAIHISSGHRYSYSKLQLKVKPKTYVPVKTAYINVQYYRYLNLI